MLRSRTFGLEGVYTNGLTALVLVRLHRYRRNFTALLANSNTSRSRFVRLFAICLVWLAISVPLQTYVISRQAAVQHEPFDWSRDHDPRAWETIEKSPSYGQIVYTRYIWLGGAVAIFLFFGFGRDACGMYAKGLRAVGLNRCFPVFRYNPQTPARNAPQSGTISSIGSKAKLVFSRKSNSASQSVKSWATDSRSSKATASSMVEPLSPKTMQYLETVQENSRMPAPNENTFTSRLSS